MHPFYNSYFLQVWFHNVEKVLIKISIVTFQYINNSAAIKTVYILF